MRAASGVPQPATVAGEAGPPKRCSRAAGEVGR
jgi:hypothetical protein